MSKKSRSFKRGSKPLIFYTIITSTVLVLFVLGYVGLKLECELLIKQKTRAEKKLTEVSNKKVNLIAQDQYLASEERITKIASEELGMIKRSTPFLILNIDKNKIDKISKVIKDKYE